MAEEIKANWKEDIDTIGSEDDFLNGLPFDGVSSIQQMLYLIYKKIKGLETRIQTLESG